MTISENLFERFTTQTNFRISRVATVDGARRPDYVGRNRVRRARHVVVEVKELQPSPAEAKAIADGMEKRFWNMPSVMPGERIRRAIDDAGPQLRALSKGEFPAVLVIRDEILGESLHSDLYSVLTAMRGLDVVPVTVAADRSQRPIFGATRPGGRKRMTKRHNTSISAVAFLHAFAPKAVVMHVYNNPHAAIPLRLRDLPRHGVVQFVMKKDQSGWNLRVPSS